MSLSFKITLILMLMTANGFCQAPLSGIVINEILFNPSKDGFDYVEIYNNSDSSFDLQEFQIAKRNITGDISGMKYLSRVTMPLKRGEFAIITGNEKWLRQKYHVAQNALVLQVSSMPSFPDDEGSVLLIKAGDSSAMDELHYDSKWHFALIADQQGVALERINPNRPTQDKNNWTSAASSSGFGTPGSVNSQATQSSTLNSELIIEPAIFSPDNDGYNDFARIKFNIPEPGYITNLVIYNLAGLKVRYLLKNEYLGTSAEYIWDGLDDNSKALPQGIYFLCSEIFKLNGKTKKFKKMITLARRL